VTGVATGIEQLPVAAESHAVAADRKYAVHLIKVLKLSGRQRVQRFGVRWLCAGHLYGHYQ
jgi:hypothetical protein